MLLWLWWHSKGRRREGHTSLCHRAFAHECKLLVTWGISQGS